MTKKKVLLAVILSIVGACVVAAAVILCLLFIKPKAPDPLEIKAENGSVVFYAQQQSANGYTFKFRSGEKEIKVESDLDFLEIDDSVFEKGIVAGEKYKVSVCANEKVEGGSTDYSQEIEWVASKFLKAPQLSKEGDKILWTEVDGADFYQVYYTPDAAIKTYATFNTELNLEVLQGGVADIFVVAYSNKDYLYESAASNTLKNVTIVHEFPAIIQARLNSSNILTIYVEESLTEIELFIGSSKTNYSKYNLVDIKCEKSGDAYKMTVDISHLYANQNVVGIKPTPTGNNKYSGSVFWVVE